ncbi:MAG: aspartate--ammonia ligase [Clostridiales bacterium]|nr:aspartate--ammonia ligase [Clostridiales bacterium]
MKSLQIPKNYKSNCDMITNQKAIKFVKDNFERIFAEKLRLTRVSAPILVYSNTGLNDDLSGVERAVRFDIKELGRDAEIVHSLAKWKRTALKKYGFTSGYGLYTDMNAIRRDDSVDNIHSIYVDQWDWERVINREDRTFEYLKQTVKTIVEAISEVNEMAKREFPFLTLNVNKDVKFITTKEAEEMYPNATGKEREYLLTKEFGTVFLMQIGVPLSDGKPHDSRAPDYDDWLLNGDILFYNEVLDSSLEISSMGIRVDEKSLASQLKDANKEERLAFDYHKQIIAGELPLTIGGGIGQSRLCLYVLQKAHIGEVQVSLWPDGMEELAKENGIDIL